MAGTASLLAAPAIVNAQGQNGVALVIGNSKYRWEAQLPNVRRDVPDIAKRFEQLGLRTELQQDLGHDAMRQAIARFTEASRGAPLAAFYFAGHGAQWETHTYLVPADADLSTPSVVKTLPSVLETRQGLRPAAARLMVLDACRNNPADGWRQKWAAEQAFIPRGDALNEPNMLMAFSAPSGRVALDGPPGQNSPFAAALLRELAAPQVDLHALSGKVRRDLLLATEGRQITMDFDTFQGPVLLKGSPGSAPPTGARIDPARIVELPNAYAFARQKDLFMPPGLVALRPAAGSPHSSKVGAYQMATQGVTRTLLVMSVEDPQAVELVWMSRYKGAAFWRVSHGKISGDILEFTGASNGSRFEFKWKDAHSGTAAEQIVDLNDGRNGRIFTGTFTRLDG